MYWDLGFLKVFLCIILSPNFYSEISPSSPCLLFNFRLFTVINLSAGVLSAQQVVSKSG